MEEYDDYPLNILYMHIHVMVYLFYYLSILCYKYGNDEINEIIYVWNSMISSFWGED